MRRESSKLSFHEIFLIIIPQLFFFLLFYYQAYQRNDSFEIEYQILSIFIIQLSLIINLLVKANNISDYSVISNFFRVSASWVIVFMIISVIGFISKTSSFFSREVILLSISQSLLLHFSINQFVRLVVSLSLSDETSPALLIHSSDNYFEISKKLEGNNNFQVAREIIIDSFKNESSIIDYQIVIIALSAKDLHELNRLHDIFIGSHAEIIWIPPINIPGKSISAYRAMNHGAFLINHSPFSIDPNAYLIKRGLDVTVSLITIILLLPLFVFISLIIKLYDFGPIFFIQERHGLNGKIFKIYKFRSMKLHNDRLIKQAQVGDKRVTAVGRFLRRTSLDEIPQFINVLKGEMSLVGPRPHATTHNSYYYKKINDYMSRHRMKPGITGFAQINGLRGETDTLEKMEQRFSYDLDYINNWSLMLDIKILVKTPIAIFTKDGAY